MSAHSALPWASECPEASDMESVVNAFGMASSGIVLPAPALKAILSGANAEREQQVLGNQAITTIIVSKRRHRSIAAETTPNAPGSISIASAKASAEPAMPTERAIFFSGSLSPAQCGSFSATRSRAPDAQFPHPLAVPAAHEVPAPHAVATENPAKPPYRRDNSDLHSSTLLLCERPRPQTGFCDKTAATAVKRPGAPGGIEKSHSVSWRFHAA